MLEAEETTKSGIILAASAKEKPQIAEVVAVGPGGVVDGKRKCNWSFRGDRVLTGKYAGTEVKVDGENIPSFVRPTFWHSGLIDNALLFE